MNELFKWIDEAIAKKHIKHYEYKYFKNIQEIGIGGRWLWKSFIVRNGKIRINILR
ncbi:hypothetical protein RirG_204460 [Rhizophagus irregularis DAOM 197198w]|uniref:Uncharacterized protein n=1 Tax=Rhizophagus irregularis (strain DAOM 197198w) TaxID=1432141 RepID=A0A015ITY0_RHIIW|nr:hypothetical protein RirG_204460 [Rhizophagus irregularis DAOM 197198w]